jgi:hypothetical protein
MSQTVKPAWMSGHHMFRVISPGWRTPPRPAASSNGAGHSEVRSASPADRRPADAEHSAEHLDVAEHRECLQPDPDGQPSDAAAAQPHQRRAEPHDAQDDVIDEARGGAEGRAAGVALTASVEERQAAVGVIVTGS